MNFIATTRQISEATFISLTFQWFQWSTTKIHSWNRASGPIEVREKQNQSIGMVALICPKRPLLPQIFILALASCLSVPRYFQGKALKRTKELELLHLASDMLRNAIG